MKYGVKDEVVVGFGLFTRLVDINRNKKRVTQALLINVYFAIKQKAVSVLKQTTIMGWGGEIRCI